MQPMAGLLPQSGEIENVLDMSAQVGGPDAQRRAAQEDVLADRRVGVEAQRNVEQRLARARYADLPRGRRVDAIEHAQQGGLSGTVTPKNGDAVTFVRLEADVVENPRIVALGRVECGAKQG